MSATIPDKSRKRNGRKTRERDRKKSRERNRRILNERKRRILKRIENRPGPERDQPMMTATNIHYELADRVQGLSPGGIGVMHLLARRTGLIGDIDRNLHLFKRHLPYHESDHVLNIAYNILAGGKRIEHLELRRNDEVYLNALGAVRIPDPTTAGDFCRRFSEHDVVTLMDAVNETRLRVWSEQPPEFFTQAIIDGDGTLVETDAECKQGVDIAYDGTWSYHPLLISLANTAEPLYLVNRSGNRPSQEQAEVYFDKAISLCRRAGFQKILLRGDTKFTQCTHLDRWDDAGDIQFVFGMAATDNLKELADDSHPRRTASWNDHPGMRSRPRPASNPNGSSSRSSGSEGTRRFTCSRRWSPSSSIAPSPATESYRMIVVRKLLGTDKGQMRLFEEYRYFFYITNDRVTPADEIVFSANDRCDQENLIAQLKSGVYALTTPVDDLVSNWAYMVMASLAWSLKAWSALMTPVSPRHAAKHQAEKRSLLRMEFATFCAATIQMPCQIVRSGGRLIYRLLSWNPWQGAFLRLVERLHGCWLC